MRRSRRILVVEDDPAIRAGLADALSAAGYEVLEAPDGESGLARALGEGVDLVLLDLMLPGVGGLEVLREVRVARPALPILILTALGAEDDRVRGLQLGADDYVVKPFSLRELLARVAAMLRRGPSQPVGDAQFPIPGGQADRGRGEIRFDDGRRCELGEMEMRLLRYLAANPGRPLSRDELLLHVWQMRPEGIETRTIDMHVARLREKLAAGPAGAAILKTVRGKGYMFDAGDTP